MRLPSHYQQGFTLIELIMIIVMLSILAYSVGGRFTTINAFSAVTAQQQFLATLLLTQQQALASADSQQAISLRLLQSDDQWQMDICRGARSGELCLSPAIDIYRNNIDRETATLRINGVNFSGSQVFLLDNNGNLNPRTLNYRLDIITSTSHVICLSTSGTAFVPVGDCPWE